MVPPLAVLNIKCGVEISVHTSVSPTQQRAVSHSTIRAAMRLQGSGSAISPGRHASRSSPRCAGGAMDRCLRLHVLCRGAGGRGRGGGGRTRTGPGGMKLREYKASDGKEHLGSSLSPVTTRPFPGPPPDSGPPLRILPIGGLGEIGMNCMLVGAYDRYVVIDAGLMFPDFQDLGMQKILPDTSFLHQWRDKIEALVITHGHEDHIGAMPWVVPALDPSTPIYASSFVMRLIRRRMTEFSLWDEERFKVFDMNTPFKAGPFEIEAVRVTHSIPDCCGLIMRNEHGTIVHTGDWKIDETPVDGLEFDRTTFEKLSKENIALMMSDSTNVLSPGRTASERVVEASLMQKVAKHQGKGRVIITQFASNLHRMHSVKQAADATGRKIAFVGMSLNHYLEAAWKDGRAPIDPKDVLQAADVDDMDPNEVLIITTGSQAEPRAALSLASREASHQLKIKPNDLVLYSARVIPGNEKRVVKMLNSIAAQGASVVQGRSDNLHVSGHAHQEELKEVLRLVQPQHFLPVHGEYSFLCEHARLAREEAGILNCSVIKNGTMLGVSSLRNRKTLPSTSTVGAGIVGEVNLVNFYNDGNKGTGTAQEMAIEERTVLAFEGIVVLALDIYRIPGSNLSCRCRVTTRGMWTDNGQMLRELHMAAEGVVSRMAYDTALSSVERSVIEAVRRASRAFNNKKPEVICIAHEHDPSTAHFGAISATRGGAPPAQRGGGAPRPSGGAGSRAGSGTGREGASAPSPYGPGPTRPWEGRQGSGGSRSQTGSMDRAGQAWTPQPSRLGLPRGPDAPSDGELSGSEDPAAPAAAPGIRGGTSDSAPSDAAPAAAPSPSRRGRAAAAAAPGSEETYEGQGSAPKAGAEGASDSEEGSSDKSTEALVVKKLLEARKAAQASRKTSTRSKKAAAAAADPGLPGPPQEVLPEDVMTKRRKRNPREKPADGADAAYD